MRKLMLLMSVLAMLTLGSANCDAQSHKSSHKSKTTKTTTKLTPEAFVNKWGNKLELFCQGVCEYGWPKSFFTQMQETFPNNFHMKYAMKKDGITYYTCAFIPDDGSNILSGCIGFQGSKLYGYEFNSWGYDYDYINQLEQQLDWNRQ